MKKTSEFFATRDLLIESSCTFSACEIGIAPFEVNEDDSYVINKSLSRNIRGFSVRSLQMLVSYLY